MKQRTNSILLAVLTILIAMLLSVSCPMVRTTGYESGTIIGRLLLPEGTGEGISQIYLYIEEKPGFMQVAAPGETFVIEGLEEDTPYTLYAASEPMGVIRGERASSRDASDSFAARLEGITAATGSGTELGSVLLKQTGIIEGQVQLHGQDEHVGIDVYIPGTSFGAKTDEAGYFRIYYVPQGMYRLRAEKAMWQAKWVENVLVEGDSSGTSQPVTILDSVVKLYKGYGTIQGTVQLAGGIEDTAGITVLLKNSSDTEAVYSMTTDTNGEFSVSFLAPGNYEVTVSKVGFTTQVVPGVVLEASETVVMEAIKLTAVGGTIQGTVELSGAVSQEGIAILAEHIDGTPTYAAITNTSGAFTIDNIFPGDYIITASKSGYESSQIVDVRVLAGETSFVEFPALIQSTGTISGRVITAGASDYSGISIAAVRVDDNMTRYSTVSSMDGGYALSGVSRGQYAVTLQKDGFISRTGITVQVNFGETVTVDDVSLTSIYGQVNGSVFLQGASEHGGVTVLLDNQEAGGSDYSTVSDPEGAYRVANVRAGTYIAYVNKQGYTTKSSVPFVLTQGGEHTVGEIELAVAFRSVSGSVTLEGQSDHAGVLVTATNLAEESRIYSAISNSGGVYALAGMVPGEYRIVLSAGGYRTKTLATIDLREGEQLSLETEELVIARGTVTGIVRKEGWSDHSGITVELIGTEYRTSTTGEGIYTFSVPSGNYPGGVRFSCEDFSTGSDSETITVLTDSAYGIADHEIAGTHASIEGNINYTGPGDDSGITVTILELTEFETETDGEGNYGFAHVPLGTYTLRYTRDKSLTITTEVEVSAAPVNRVKQLQIIPDSSTVEGYIYLTGLTDHKGTTVSITTEGYETLQTKTDSSGYFYIGSIVSSGNHTVTAENDGWNSAVFELNDLEVLETRVIGVDPKISLVDTISPEITRIVINNGADLSNSRNVTIRIESDERGSGVSEMQVSFDGACDTEAWEPFSAGFETTIPQEGDGERTVTVRLKDAAGNIGEAAADSITVTQSMRIVSGVLTGEDLQWQKSDGIILVQENVKVESGDTLVIEPGTTIKVSEGRYLRVEGEILAVGTEVNPIVFTPEVDGGTWNGIEINSPTAVTVDSEYGYLSGSTLQYCRVINGEIKGANSYIYRSELNHAVRATHVVENKVAGDVTANVVVGNDFTAAVTVNSLYGTTIAQDNNFTSDATVNMSRIEGNSIIGNLSASGTRIEGNSVDGLSSVNSSGLVGNNEFLGGLQITGSSGRYLNNTVLGRFEVSGSGNRVLNNLIEDLEQKIIISAANELRYNVIGPVWDTYVLEYRGAEGSELDAKHNYWGTLVNHELEQKGERTDISYFYDYYDDFTKGKIVYGGHEDTVFSTAGYREEGALLYDIAYSMEAQPQLSIGDDYTITINDAGLLEVAVEMEEGRSAGWMRMSTGYEALEGAAWEVYTGSTSFGLVAGDVAADEVNVYLQLRDSSGEESGIVSERLNLGEFPVTGPAGGYIFYGKGYESEGWRYLEAAPYGWYNGGGDPRVPWGGYGTSTGAVDTKIGRGKTNTERIVSVLGEAEPYAGRSDYAAKICQDAEINGYTDWFLPSRDELNLIYRNLYLQGEGGFSSYDYWSSSEYSNGYAWRQYFSYGSQNYNHYKDYVHYIRAVRAF